MLLLPPSPSMLLLLLLLLTTINRYLRLKSACCWPHETYDLCQIYIRNEAIEGEKKNDENDDDNKKKKKKRMSNVKQLIRTLVGSPTIPSTKHEMHSPSIFNILALFSVFLPLLIRNEFVFYDFRTVGSIGAFFFLRKFLWKRNRNGKIIEIFFFP